VGPAAPGRRGWRASGVIGGRLATRFRVGRRRMGAVQGIMPGTRQEARQHAGHNGEIDGIIAAPEVHGAEARREGCGWRVKGVVASERGERGLQGWKVLGWEGRA